MKISTMLKALFMQSETENPVELEASVPSRYHIRNFELFEEYSRRGIAETIKERREIYEKAGSQGKRKIETEADTEISNFQIWLESVKKLAPQAAHYYSVSLKSLLMGLPTGLKIAQLFNAMLENI
jgi:plasmid replication initiation protein